MLLFYHSQQAPSNANHCKGKLFEGLLGRYLSTSGYDVNFRVKHASLEYDLEGKHKVDRGKVVGEAKAHGRSISGEILTSFVGKLFPLGLHEGSVTGLFLSTSPLTAEAADYYSSISKFKVRVYTGEDLFAQVREALSLPKAENLEQQVCDQGYFPQASHLLASDTDIYTAVLAATADSAGPSHFAIFRSDGTRLVDTVFGNSLRDSVAELQSLEFIDSPIGSTALTGRTVASGLAVGSDWDDYRLPAAPTRFVGRGGLVENVTIAFAGDSSRVLQIKSRSGVGKSSLLAFLDDHLNASGYHAQAHDARDVKSVLDLFAVVRRFAGGPRVPRDIREAEQALARLNESERRSVLLVDQFESTFTQPELFDAYEALASSLAQRPGSVHLVLARKNDQLTTFDEKSVSLDRLNALSRSFELKDFDIPEAAELIDRIAETASKKISPDVKTFVLEFAQGFPWLIKRTMAHILRLVRAGVAQRELFATGLRLGELFDEELEGLDEVEREYLVRLAPRLPADLHQLQRDFDEDPNLLTVLDKLTRSRLLRLAGSTYDTYNDVFKEYLVYQRLPDFRETHNFRLYPQAVFRHFGELIQRESWTTRELESALELSRGTLFNLIRELRSLGLLKKEGRRWAVPRVVLDVYDRGTLGDYVRRAMMENAVVADLVAETARKGTLDPATLPEFLKARFVFIEAVPSTWETYSKMLRSWCTTLMLLTYDKGQLTTSRASRTEIVNRLGNLTASTRIQGRTRSDLFLPTVHWNRFEQVADELLGGKMLGDNQSMKGLADLRALRLLDGDTLAFKSRRALRRRVKALFKEPPYSRLWEAVEAKEKLLPVFYENFQSGVAESTALWRLKVLLNWARKLKLVPNKKYNYGA